MKEVEVISKKKMSQPTEPSERFLYTSSLMESPLRGSTVNEKYINNKILPNNIFDNNNNNNNIKKAIRNYYEIETNNYKKKLSRYKNYINVAEITELLL